MNYSVGDIFVWTYQVGEISTIIEVYRDWNGQKRYKLKSYLKQGYQEYITESYTEQELDKLLDRETIKHYPVVE